MYYHISVKYTLKKSLFCYKMNISRFHKIVYLFQWKEMCPFRIEISIQQKYVKEDFKTLKQTVLQKILARRKKNH